VPVCRVESGNIARFTGKVAELEPGNVMLDKLSPSEGAEVGFMAERILSFYEPLADHYHLIFDDWNSAIKRQAKILNALLAAQMRGHPLKILDCACGIGTQALGLAGFGHQVIASDLSQAEVNRAKHEAEIRALDISFHASDMTSLAEIADRDFDVVAALDNALPHLTADQLSRAVEAVGSKLKSNGLFIASIRDYDTLILERPTIQEPAFYGGKGDRRIVYQVWDWIDDTRYALHLYITMQSDQVWKSHHFVSEYRCLLRNELSTVLQSTGFREVRWLMPAESGFYQPLVLARRA
jgi:glycine/sarcosine N-methyltransferase